MVKEVDENMHIPPQGDSIRALISTTQGSFKFVSPQSYMNKMYLPPPILPPEEEVTPPPEEEAPPPPEETLEGYPLRITETWEE